MNLKLRCAPFAKEVQTAGAIALIVYNNIAGVMDMGGVHPDVTIPVLLIERIEGLVWSDGTTSSASASTSAGVGRISAARTYSSAGVFTVGCQYLTAAMI